MGMHGESWVNNAIQQADLLIALGMRFDDRVTGNLAHYAPNAKKIHVEIDPSEINKNVKVDVALIGDLKQTLQTLQPLLASNAPASPSTGEWLREITQSKGTAAVRDIINLPDNGHLYAAHVIHDIWREAVAAGREKETIIVTDVGQHQMWEAQYFKHEAPRSLVTSGGLGTMGFALPAAIGAKVACPEKDVWVIAGDGGFQMTASELSTIRRRASRSTSPSSTMASSAWSASGRRPSTTRTTRPAPSSPGLCQARRRPRHRRRSCPRAQERNADGHTSAHQRQALPDQLPGGKGRRRLSHDRARRGAPRDGSPSGPRSPARNRGGRIDADATNSASSTRRSRRSPNRQTRRSCRSRTSMPTGCCDPPR